MIDMLEVRKKIGILLDTLGSKVFYENAGDNQEMPYLIFNLVDSNFDGANSEYFTLDIDGWDVGESSVALETLMHNMNELMQKNVTIINNNLSFRTVLDRRFSLNDSDSDILRRKYQYQLRLFR